MPFLSLLGPPTIDELKSKEDFEDLIKALEFKHEKASLSTAFVILLSLIRGVLSVWKHARLMK